MNWVCLLLAAWECCSHFRVALCKLLLLVGPTCKPWLCKVPCLLCKEALWTRFCIREKSLFVTAIISVIFTRQCGNCQLEATYRGALERLLNLFT